MDSLKFLGVADGGLAQHLRGAFRRGCVAGGGRREVSVHRTESEEARRLSGGLEKRAAAFPGERFPEM